MKTDVNTFVAVMKCVSQHCRKMHGEESGRRNVALLDTIVDGELLRELAIKVDLSHHTAVQFLELVNESRRGTKLYLWLSINVRTLQQQSWSGS